ncbi:MAG: hypothetical protein M5U34_18470 [Chloroflexi bacterium]|nr:hypothetical protein [Chloroflexota bacterium]
MAKGTEAHLLQLQNVTLDLQQADLAAVIQELELNPKQRSTTIARYLMQILNEPQAPSPLISSDQRAG